jgi:hypothetical protein
MGPKRRLLKEKKSSLFSLQTFYNTQSTITKTSTAQHHFTTMMSPTTFPRFPDLAPELQVMIIDYALDEAMDQRKERLVLRLHSHQAPKEKNSDKAQKTRSPRPIIKLPQLPAIYHTSRLFRAEASRVQPIHQLLADDRLKTLQYRRGSMVMFDPAHDKIVLDLRHRSSNSAFDACLLNNVIELMTKAARSPDLKCECVVIIVAKTYALAADAYNSIVETAYRHARVPYRGEAKGLEQVKEGVGLWRATVEFEL